MQPWKRLQNNNPYLTGLFIDFDGGNEDGDHVSANPIYDVGDMPMGWSQSPGDRPTSMTITSVTNPNYESTLEGGAERERVASNPIYQTATEYEEQNPLYETGGSVPEKGCSHADVNPLYEPGPVGNTHGGSGGMADSKPLYQSATSFDIQSDINPTINHLYEGTSDASPLYESATTAEQPNRGKLRRRVDSRTKRADELPIIDGAWAGDDGDDDDGLGVSNKGADITVNELYGSVEQPHFSPFESEPDAPPVPPRQHTKRS